MRGREDDEMSHDDTEFDKAKRTPEFQHITLINQAYRAGYKQINDYLDTLPPERAAAWRKKVNLPKPRKARKPKPEAS
jgi:hypothetical protein